MYRSPLTKRSICCCSYFPRLPPSRRTCCARSLVSLLLDVKGWEEAINSQLSKWIMFKCWAFRFIIFMYVFSSYLSPFRPIIQTLKLLNFQYKRNVKLRRGSQPNSKRGITRNILSRRYQLIRNTCLYSVECVVDWLFKKKVLGSFRTVGYCIIINNSVEPHISSPLRIEF